MAVPLNPPSGSSSKQNLFLRLLFLMVVVFAFTAWEVSYAESSFFEEAVDFDDDNIPVDDEDFNDDDVPVDDEEFDDEKPGAEALGYSLETGANGTPGKCPLDASHETCAMEDAPGDKTCSMEDAPAESKSITAPIVKLLVTKKTDKKTGQANDVIELEENRLMLDEHGRGTILIDASALPASYQSEAMFQLSLRYRRQCPGSGVSRTVYQESAVKPFSSSRNLYRLQVDFCEERKGQVFSLYFAREKTIRSMVSKFGSAASYLIAAKMAGNFAAARTDSNGRPYWIPNGDNSGFMDNLAAALPVGAVFNGVADFREEIEHLNLSGYEDAIAPCVTTALMASALNVLDPNFISNTEEMFVSRAARHYSRSAYFGELYECTKKTVIDPLVYSFTGSIEAYDAESEKMSSTIADIVGSLFIFSFKFIDRAEAEIRETRENSAHHPIKGMDKPGLIKLEQGLLGNTIKGATASLPYRLVSTIDNHHIDQNESWSSLLYRTLLRGGIWFGSTAAIAMMNPLLRHAPGRRDLSSLTFWLANGIEAGTAYSFMLLNEYAVLPAADYIADRAVSLNLTVPDSWMYKSTKTAVRLGFSAGASYVGINAVNYAGEIGKKVLVNSQSLIDLVTATTTNGAILPFTLQLGDDMFTHASDRASYFLCSPKGWGIGCPTKELQIGIVLDKTGMLAADTHNNELVTSD